MQYDDSMLFVLNNDNNTPYIVATPIGNLNEMSQER